MAASLDQTFRKRRIQEKLRAIGRKLAELTEK